MLPFGGKTLPGQQDQDQWCLHYQCALLFKYRILMVTSPWVTKKLTIKYWNIKTYIQSKFKSMVASSNTLETIHQEQEEEGEP